jgi:hypothetical protein
LDEREPRLALLGGSPANEFLAILHCTRLSASSSKNAGWRLLSVSVACFYP